MKDSSPPNSDNEEELRQKIATGSQYPSDYIELASLIFEAGRYDEALALIQQGAGLPLANLPKAQIYSHLGWLFYYVGKLEQALTQAQKTRELLSTEPEDVEVLFLQGMTESLLAESLPDAEASKNAARSGLRWLKRLISEAPNFEDITFAYLHAARLSNVLGNSRDAVTFYEKCLQRDLESNDRIECLEGLAEAFRIDNRFAEAERVIAEAFDCAKNDRGKLPKLYFTLGLIQRSANRLADAKKAFQQVVLDLKNHPDLHVSPDLLSQVYWNLGELYYELGEYENAVATFRELLGVYPEDDLYRRNVFVWLGQSYHEAGNLNAARNSYEQVLNSANASEIEKSSTRLGLGKVYYDSGDQDKAIKAFQNVFACFTSDNPIHSDALLWLGYSYDAKGEYEKARDCWEEVLASPHASEKVKASAQEGLAHLPQLPRKTLH